MIPNYFARSFTEVTCISETALQTSLQLYVFLPALDLNKYYLLSRIKKNILKYDFQVEPKI
jgi:hypothetical protein